ncbi:MAG: hypothetical protein ACR2N2_02700 [Acidimicrobiia bacterium]
MIRRISLFAALLAVGLSACSLSDDVPAETTVPPGGAEATSTTIAPPSEGNTESFRGIPPPTFATYAAESGSAQSPCREYTSTETPYTVATGHSEDLAALGWTVTNLFRTGYRHADGASFDATKDGRTIRVEGSGATETTSAYSICITQQ